MSKIKYEVAKILKQEGWINDVEVIKGSGKKNEANAFDELKLVLKYKKSGKSFITSIKRISKPGLRVYADKNNLPKVLNNLGIAIVSTSSGLMTNKEARKKGLGGEIICEVY
jgi:small subunit ribosomal protein S8